MEKRKKLTSKTIFLGIALFILILIGFLLYEFLKFKPDEPLRDESGVILSTPTNGYRYFKEEPTIY